MSPLKFPLVLERQYVPIPACRARWAPPATTQRDGFVVSDIIYIEALAVEVAGLDEQVWQEARFDIVVAANMAKFGEHADLREYLVNTGDRVLVEASPRDRIWGIGLAANDERAAQPDQWRGLNLLGFALMKARAALR